VKFSWSELYAKIEMRRGQNGRGTHDLASCENRMLGRKAMLVQLENWVNGVVNLEWDDHGL
jgi:hypothetical protein